MLLVLLSAIVAVLALGAAVAFAVVRGLALWRTFKAFGRQVEDALARVSEAGDRVSEQTATLGKGGAALAPSLSRLSASRAQLAVLLAAVSDVRAAFGRVTGVMPKK